MKVQYTLVSPAKNYTIIVTSPVAPEDRMKVNDAIMTKEPLAEQLGFVTIDGDTARLDMAGGEFCGNACRSVALVTGKKNIICAGEKVTAEGDAVYIPKGFKSIKFKFFGLEDLEKHDKKYYEVRIKQEGKPIGYMFGNFKTAKVEVLVYIPGPNTMYWENSCASGAACVARTACAMWGIPVVGDFNFPGGNVHVSVHPDSHVIKIKGDIEVVKSDTIEVI